MREKVNVDVALHEELSAREGREGALVVEGREALEGGEKGVFGFFDHTNF